jgi:hypothetical protein
MCEIQLVPMKIAISDADMRNSAANMRGMQSR